MPGDGWPRGGALALPAAEALGFVPVVAAESEPAPSVTSASMPAGIVEMTRLSRCS